MSTSATPADIRRFGRNLRYRSERAATRRAVEALRNAAGHCEATGHEAKALVAVERPDGEIVAMCVPHYVNGDL